MAGLFRSFLDSLTGKPGAPVYSTAATSGSRYASPPGAAAPLASGLVKRKVRVLRVERETADAVTLHFAPLTPEPLRYRAGQFLSFDLLLDGEDLRRAYSFSSSPLDGDGGAASVTVKRVPGGRVSGYLNERVEAGAVFEVMGPSGDFTVEPPPVPASRPRSFVFVAGGSGMTPLFSLTTTLLRSEPGVDITLLYGNRRAEDILFRERLAALAAQFPNLRVKHVLEQRPDEDATLSVGANLEVAALGQLSGERVIELASRHASNLDDTNFYVCGPEPMMDSVVTALIAHGVRPERVRTERFTAPARRTSTRPTHGHAIRFSGRFTGSTRTVLTKPGQTLLEAGIGAGLPLSYSCGLGGCAACKVKVTRGAVIMDEPNCLSSAERAEGYVLACVAYAAAPIEVDA